MAWLRSVPRAMVDRGEAIDEVVTEIGCEFLDEVLGEVLIRMAACGPSIFWFCGRAISLR